MEEGDVVSLERPQNCGFDASRITYVLIGEIVLILRNKQF